MGMEPLKIIQSATSMNADFFRIENKLGTIAKGKTADLLLVNGNPLRDIREMRQVDRVMLAGTWIM